MLVHFYSHTKRHHTYYNIFSDHRLVTNSQTIHMILYIILVTINYWLNMCESIFISALQAAWIGQIFEKQLKSCHFSFRYFYLLGMHCYKMLFSLWGCSFAHVQQVFGIPWYFVAHRCCSCFCIGI